MLKKLLAAAAKNTDKFQFGNIEAPPGLEQAYGSETQGLIILLNNILKLAIYASGLIALINLIVSGIQYIGSSGKPEFAKQASSRIWISLLGLIVIAGSLALAAVFGLIYFGDATAIINPQLPTGGQP